MRSYEAKLARADEHLRSFKDANQRFVDPGDYGVVQEFDSQTGEQVFRFDAGSAPGHDIANIVGDYVHNLRSSLDHLFYVLAGDPPPDPGVAAFPITTTPAIFANASTAKKIQGVPPGAVAIIEGLQAYHRGDREYLYYLQQLDDVDKHRALPLVTQLGGVVLANIIDLEARSIRGPRTGPMEHGAEILRYRPVPNSHVKVHFRLSCGIAFAQGQLLGGSLVGPFLEYLIRFVRSEVVAPLEPFL